MIWDIGVWPHTMVWYGIWQSGRQIPSQSHFKWYIICSTSGKLSLFKQSVSRIRLSLSLGSYTIPYHLLG